MEPLKKRIMAKPIKEPPFLYGKDASTFVKDNKEVKKATEKEKEEIKEELRNFDEYRRI